MKSRLSSLFLALALLLSHTMCITVAVHYTNLWWGGRYAGYSFPAWAAFLLAVPFGAGIAVCLLLAWHFRRR